MEDVTVQRPLHWLSHSPGTARLALCHRLPQRALHAWRQLCGLILWLTEAVFAPCPTRFRCAVTLAGRLPIVMSSSDACDFRAVTDPTPNLMHAGSPHRASRQRPPYGRRRWGRPPNTKPTAENLKTTGDDVKRSDSLPNGEEECAVLAHRSGR